MNDPRRRQSSMKVLIADKFEQSGIDALQAGGCDVLYQPDLKDASPRRGAGGARRPTCSSCGPRRSPKPILEASQLSLVVRAGAGYDTIDVKAASRRGIYVSNCPGKNSIAVAELAFGLILSLDRRIPDNVAELRAGKWNKKEYSKARGLHGRTLGLLGFGSIGQEMAKRAQAFGMNVAVWSEIGVEVGRDGLPVDLPLLVRLRPSSADADRADRPRCYETPAEVAAQLRHPQRAPRAQRQDARPRRTPRCFGQHEARLVLRQHRARRGRGLQGARDGVQGEGPPRGGRRLRARSRRRRAATSRIRSIGLPERLRHAPHRRVDRSGAGSHRRRDRAHRPDLRADRPRAERGQPGAQDAGHARAGGPPPGQARRAGARLRPAARGRASTSQETENIIFADAEAAVARVNIDGEPPADVVAAIKSGNPTCSTCTSWPMTQPSA